MSKLRDAAQQALEALDRIYSPLHVREINKVGAAMVALRAALAEQPEQEPLTDEEIYECDRIAAIRHHRHKTSIRGQQMTPADDPQWHFARAIIAAYERKNGIGEQP